MRRFLLLVAALVALNGCERKILDTPSVSSNVVLPLAVGNQWSYETTITQEGKAPETWKFYRTITAKQRVFYQGKSLEVYLLRDTSDPEGRVTRFEMLLRNEPDGLYRYGEGLFGGGLRKEGTMDKQLLVKFPGAVGDVWRVEHGDYHHRLIYLSTNADFTTPAGSFQCLIFRSGDTETLSWYTDDYYAPNIGWIGSITQHNNQVPKQTTKIILLDYKLH